MTLRIPAISYPSMTPPVSQPPSARQEDVRAMFDGIARRYDLLNHLLSSGIDIYWRSKAIRLLKGFHPQTVLDVATGTADFAIEAARSLQAKVVGIDISQEMLSLGRIKVTQKAMNDVVSLRMGSAESLDFEDSVFDAVIVAFGARNFADLRKGLAEMHRVLKPGGHVLILEFSKPRGFPVGPLYDFYFHHIVPFIGGLISKHRDSYEYLPRSVSEFPEDTAFLNLMDTTGFAVCTQHRLTFGIATAYLGTKTTT